MSSEKMSINAPVWTHLTSSPPSSFPAFHESWYLRLGHPDQNRALALKYSVLISSNGFRRIAEVTAFCFEKSADREPVKIALKQQNEIDSFSYSAENGIRIGECGLSANRAYGRIQSKGRVFSWDLNLAPRKNSPEPHYEMIPLSLRKAGIFKNSIATPHPDLTITGKCELDGQAFQWDQCPGMQGHQSCPRSGHSWVWGHCNSFINEQGVPTPFVFEGLSLRTRWLGWIPSPRVLSFYFHYQDKPYFFNSVNDLLRLQSSNTLTEWRFQADRNDLSFRGVFKARHKDFAGITLEDTNGALIYTSNTQVADLTIHVYRNGKLEATLNSVGGAALEIASPHKNPYVPQVI